MVQQRIDAPEGGIGIALEILGDIEPGIGVQTLCNARSHEVRQRVQPAPAYLGIAVEIVTCVEVGMRVVPLGCAPLQIVHQRIHAGTRHIRIPAGIVMEIEQGMRVAPLVGPEDKEVSQRIGPGARHIRIASEIVVPVEKAALQHLRAIPEPLQIPQGLRAERNPTIAPAQQALKVQEKIQCRAQGPGQPPGPGLPQGFHCVAAFLKFRISPTQLVFAGLQLE